MPPEGTDDSAAGGKIQGDKCKDLSFQRNHSEEVSTKSKEEIDPGIIATSLITLDIHDLFQSMLDFH